MSEPPPFKCPNGHSIPEPAFDPALGCVVTRCSYFGKKKPVKVVSIDPAVRRTLRGIGSAFPEYSDAPLEPVEPDDMDEAEPVDAEVIDGGAEPVSGDMHPGLGRRLRGYIEEAERLIDERNDINLQVRALFDAAKEAGFSVKAMRELIKRRAMDPAVRADFDETLALYETVVGMGGTISGGVLRAGGPPVAEPEVADAKLTKAAKARRDAVTLAELARAARGEN